MATQVFRVTGTDKKTGKKIDDLAKTGGGNMTEESLLRHYRRNKMYKNVDDLKITFVRVEDGNAIDESGVPVPPARNGAASSSSSAQAASSRK